MLEEQDINTIDYIIAVLTAILNYTKYWCNFFLLLSSKVCEVAL